MSDIVCALSYRAARSVGRKFSITGAPTEALVSDIDRDGNVTINQQGIPRDELAMRIRDIIETRTDKSLFLRAHERLRYAEILAVLDIARRDGVERVGIVSR